MDTRAPRHHPPLPACHPRRRVGAPPVRCPRPPEGRSGHVTGLPPALSGRTGAPVETDLFPPRCDIGVGPEVTGASVLVVRGEGRIARCYAVERLQEAIDIAFSGVDAAAGPHRPGHVAPVAAAHLA